jgi:hypothetical protein
VTAVTLPLSGRSKRHTTDDRQKEDALSFASLTHAPLFGLLGLVISALPVVAGILYAIRPDERRLALMRPLSLAAIFASISNLLLGVANGLHALAAHAGSAASYGDAGPVLGEALIPSFVGFAFLTVAWLCVAIATRRAA